MAPTRKPDAAARRRLAAAVQRRMDDELISQADVLEHSGMAVETFEKILNGDPIQRLDVYRRLCKAIGWTYRSIGLVLDGGDPELELPEDMDRRQPGAGRRAEDQAMEERFRRIEQNVARILRQLGDEP